jgi:hypothetical protein
MWTPLALAAVLVLGQAESPAADADATRIRQLVRQLDAPQLGEREKAEAALLEMGPGILQALPRESPRMTAETRQRLARVRQKFERQLAATSIQPARVTLEGLQPLGKVLKELEAQSGNRITLEVPEMPVDKPIEVDFQNAPFWEAFDEVLDKAGLTVYPYAEKGIAVRPSSLQQSLRRSSASYDGAFRFEAVSVEAARNFRAGEDVLHVVVEIAWEPRLAPVALQQRLDELEAIDSRGKPLAIAYHGAQIEVPTMPGASSTELRIPFELPPREVKSIASLSGKLHTLALGKPETFRFEKLDKAVNVEQRIAGATVVLEQVRQNNELWQVLILVRYDEARDALASHRGWVFANEAYLIGPDGKQVVPAAFDTTRQTENEVGVGYLFELDQPLAQYAFVYKTPGMIFPVELSYQLKDIALP